MTQTVIERGQFVQFPIQLIYGCPDLSRDDKWVLLSVMGVCWTPGPHRLSYRDIANISGVPISLLSSFKDKHGVVHEGIIDRLVRLEWVKVVIGKEVNHANGKLKGNAQSYISLDYDRIWKENITYCEKKRIEREPYAVKEQDYQPVSYTNRFDTIQNKPVHDESKSVSYTNGSVSNRNEPVSDLPSKEDTYITDKIDTIDSSVTLPHDAGENLSHPSYSHEPDASSSESEWLCEDKGETNIFEDDPDETAKRPVVQGGNLAPEERRAPIESEERREGTGKTRAVKPPSGPPPASPGRAAQLREQPTIQSTPHEKPRQPTETPTGDTPDASTLPTKKTDGKGNRKKSEVPLLCDTRTIHQLIDAERGWSKEKRGERIHENIVIKEWCQHHPLEHYHIVVRYLKTRDPFWSKENRVHKFFSADKLAEQTPRVLAELGLVPKPELPPDIPMPAATQPANGKYHPYTRASMYEPIEIGV